MPEQFPITLGNYTLYQELGRGGFATVYLARDDVNARDVAIKVLDDKLARDPSFISHFDQEFNLAARLDHPSIVKMLDHGEAQGRFYLVMSLVRGFDLRARIRDSGALAIPLALRISVQIADAIDYAHRQQIIHRDIKSANILLDESGNALHGDFGLMRAMEKSAFMTTYSQSQGFLGTAEYMSPEQARGEPATAHSDLYSFGVVVFEMLTGQIPFRADTALAIMRMHADASPPNPLDLRTDLPPALAIGILHALGKRPADRPPSASAFVNALQTALSAEQQAAAVRTGKIMQMRETAVTQARSRIEELKRQKDEAERARRLAEKQAAQLDKLAEESETLLKELEAEEDQVREAALEAEKARREAEQKVQIAETRVARAEQMLDRYQGTRPAASGDEIILELSLGVELVLVRVPAGEFLMGAYGIETGSQAYEKPQHMVTLDEYFIGKYPVTRLQFAAFVRLAKYPMTLEGDLTQNGAHPITNMNWNDAVAFCRWASRVTGMEIGLPAEAQWEKAARGDDGRLYPWNNSDPDASRCNFNDNVKTTTPVGTYTPHGDSPYKCADMAGNVWEWCADWYDDKYYQDSPAKNPTGPATGQFRILRGGSYCNNGPDVRCARRGSGEPSIRNIYCGFRVIAIPIRAYR